MKSKKLSFVLALDVTKIAFLATEKNIFVRQALSGAEQPGRV
jgi:hypothetical protein